MYFAAMLWVFWPMSIDTADAFSNLRDARRLAGGMLGYDIFRPPLLPLLHAPLQIVLNLLQAGSAARLSYPHAFQCVITGACLIVIYRFLRAHVSRGWAQIGIVLFSLNRITIHYFGSPMSDLPAAALFAAFLFTFESNDWKFGSALIGACLLCRWNMPVPIAGALLLDIAQKRKVDVRWFWACTIGAAIFTGTFALVYHRSVGLPWLRAPEFIVWLLRGQYESQQLSESHWTYAQGLLLTTGIVLVPFLWGAWRAVHEPSKPMRFYLKILALYAVVMSVAVGHKETRYLTPILPLFYAVAIHGLQEAQKKWRFAAAAVLGFAAAGAIGEWSRFTDPIFHNTIALDTAAVIQEHSAPDTRVFWTGSLYSLAPKKPTFMAAEPTYYIYDVPNPGETEYLLGRRVPTMTAELLNTLRPGDIMVRAPRHPYRPGWPWEPGDDRLEIVQWTQKGWSPLIRFEAARPAVGSELSGPARNEISSPL